MIYVYLKNKKFVKLWTKVEKFSQLSLGKQTMLPFVKIFLLIKKIKSQIENDKR